MYDERLEKKGKPLAEERRGKIPLKRLVIRPGSGWHQIKGAVWEHISGIRIHCAFPLVRLSEKQASMSIHQAPGGSKLFWKLFRINGGNKKRATMAWALNVAV